MTTIICAHHWIIGRAAGPASKGKCRLCGEEREFSNSVETYGGWTNRSGKVNGGQAARVQAEPDLRTASSNSRTDRLRSADCQPVRRSFFLTSSLH